MPKCVECGSISFTQHDIGFFVCDDCGTQSQDVIDERGEFNAAAIAHVGHGAITRRLHATVSYPVFEDFKKFGPNALVNGFQRVLSIQVTCLVEQFGYRPCLHNHVGRLWFAYLEHHGAERAKVPEHLWGTFADPLSGRRGLRLTSALALVYLGCLLGREPIFASDLVYLIKDGRLPYLSVADQVPPRYQPARALRPERLPSIQAVRGVARSIATIAHVDIPPINAPLHLFRCLREFSLPESCHKYLLALWSLHQSFNSQAGMVRLPNPPPSQIVSIVLIFVKLCFGIWDTPTDPTGPYFMPTRSEWRRCFRRRIALMSERHIPWTLEDLNRRSVSRLPDYLRFCEQHIFQAMNIPSEWAEYEDILRKLSPSLPTLTDPPDCEEEEESLEEEEEEPSEKEEEEKEEEEEEEEEEKVSTNRTVPWEHYVIYERRTYEGEYDPLFSLLLRFAAGTLLSMQEDDLCAELALLEAELFTHMAAT